MEKNNKPTDVVLDLNKNARKKKNKHPDRAGVIIGILLLLIGLAALFGWWKLGPLFLKVPLYIIATLIISIAFFGIIEELTAKAKSNYSMAAMLVTWSASLIYASNLTDISALRWLFLVFAGLFGFIAIIAFAVQATKDIRSRPRPILGLVTAATVIFGLYIILSSYFTLPIALSFFPLTFILVYTEYLNIKFLRVFDREIQSAEGLHESKSDKTKPYRIVLRNLRGIRPWLYGILILFFAIFYFIVTQEPAEMHDFSLFYKVVAAAYLGILAIVIAFAVLVIRRQTQQEVTEHFRRAITGLVQMYVFFAFVTVVGLLLGTEVSGEILTGGAGLGEILESGDSILNLCRLLTVESAVLAFPVGLLYLYAMIQDFLRS